MPTTTLIRFDGDAIYSENTCTLNCALKIRAHWTVRVSKQTKKTLGSNCFLVSNSAYNNVAIIDKRKHCKTNSVVEIHAHISSVEST